MAKMMNMLRAALISILVKFFLHANGVSSLTIVPLYSDGHLRNLYFNSISLSLSGLVTMTISALPTVLDVR